MWLCEKAGPVCLCCHLDQKSGRRKVFMRDGGSQARPGQGCRGRGAGKPPDRAQPLLRGMRTGVYKCAGLLCSLRKVYRIARESSSQSQLSLESLFPQELSCPGVPAISSHWWRAGERSVASVQKQQWTSGHSSWVPGMIMLELEVCEASPHN